MILASELEEARTLFSAPWERFRGYGVMGSPFSSGHLLSFRRMTSSSLGPAFTSVWHREPNGHWTMVVDVDPELSCPRFFGSAMDRIVVDEIDVEWDGPAQLSVRVPGLGLQWGMRLASDLLTRSMSWVGSALARAAWRREWVRSSLGKLGGRALGVGRISLSGQSPNGQRFVVIPRVVLRVEATAAVIRDRDLGPMGPLREQVRLGDYWIPNGGLFAIAEAGFESRKRFNEDSSLRRAG